MIVLLCTGIVDDHLQRRKTQLLLAAPPRIDSYSRPGTFQPAVVVDDYESISRSCIEVNRPPRQIL